MNDTPVFVGDDRDEAIGRVGRIEGRDDVVDGKPDVVEVGAGHDLLLGDEVGRGLSRGRDLLVEQQSIADLDDAKEQDHEHRQDQRELGSGHAAPVAGKFRKSPERAHQKAFWNGSFLNAAPE